MNSELVLGSMAEGEKIQRISSITYQIMADQNAQAAFGTILIDTTNFTKLVIGSLTTNSTPQTASAYYKRVSANGSNIYNLDYSSSPQVVDVSAYDTVTIEFLQRFTTAYATMTFSDIYVTNDGSI